MICAEMDTPVLKIFKAEFLIKALMSGLIVNKHAIYMYQDLNLAVNNQKQVKTSSLKLWQLFHDSLNTFVFFYSPSIMYDVLPNRLTIDHISHYMSSAPFLKITSSFWQFHKDTSVKYTFV